MMKMRPSTIHVTLLLTIFVVGRSVAGHTVEVCTGEQLQITCSSDEVIQMTSAKLGRMQTGRCIIKNEFMGCENDVIQKLTKKCSGRRECNAEELDLEKSENKECSDALKMYLHVTYTCLRVESRCNSNSATYLTQEEAYLSSLSRINKNCGSPRSPWIISAQPGQTINMSLIDFAASDNNNFVSCKYVYGYILERALGINHTICGGQQKEWPVYASKTNKVEIQLSRTWTRNSEEGSFILHYQILGCPELERPAHAWYRREGNEAVIGCEDNDQEWQLTCTGNTWQGSMGNCTKKAVPIVAAQEEPEQVHFHTVIIMTSVAGGAVVVVVITIVIGIVYIKKYRMRKEAKQLQKTYATMERELQAYYRPTQADMTLLASTQGTVNRLPALMPADLHANQMMSYPDQCSCATLPSRDTGDVNRLLGGSTEPRQSIYSAVK